MKRLLINSVLIMVFLGFLLAPNYPYLHYFLVRSQVTVSNADVAVKSSKTLVGDIAYLNAIINRVGDKDSKTKKEVPLPVTNHNYSQLVYDVPSGFVFQQPQNIICTYISYKQYFLKKVYLKIPSPPPEILS